MCAEDNDLAVEIESSLGKSARGSVYQNDMDDLGMMGIPL